MATGYIALLQDYTGIRVLTERAYDKIYKTKKVIWDYVYHETKDMPDKLREKIALKLEKLMEDFNTEWTKRNITINLGDGTYDYICNFWLCKADYEDEIPEEPSEWDISLEEYLSEIKIDKKKVGKYYPLEFVKGFCEGWEEDGAGFFSLDQMGIPNESVFPIDVRTFLEAQEMTLLDKDGNEAKLWFYIGKNDDDVYCVVEYAGMKDEHCFMISEYSDETKPQQWKNVSYMIGALLSDVLEQLIVDKLQREELE